MSYESEVECVVGVLRLAILLLAYLLSDRKSSLNQMLVRFWAPVALKVIPTKVKHCVQHFINRTKIGQNSSYFYNKSYNQYLYCR